MTRQDHLDDYDVVANRRQVAFLQTACSKRARVCGCFPNPQECRQTVPTLRHLQYERRCDVSRWTAFLTATCRPCSHTHTLRLIARWARAVAISLHRGVITRFLRAIFSSMPSNGGFGPGEPAKSARRLKRATAEGEIASLSSFSEADRQKMCDG